MSRERDEKEMITTLTKGLKGLLAAGLGASMLALAPHAVADTNDNAYVNAMEENNIHSVGGPADLIYAGHHRVQSTPPRVVSSCKSLLGVAGHSSFSPDSTSPSSLASPADAEAPPGASRVAERESSRRRQSGLRATGSECGDR